MINENIPCPRGAGAAAFEEVWQRVGAGGAVPNCPPSPDADAAFLRDRIDRCCADAKLYDMLACGTSGRTAQVCRDLACRKRAQLRRLQTQLFIITGETHRGSPVCPYVYDALETLRQQCLEERRSSELYLDYAAQTANTQLACLCQDLASEDLACACQLERLISRYL